MRLFHLYVHEPLDAGRRVRRARSRKRWRSSAASCCRSPSRSCTASTVGTCVTSWPGTYRAHGGGRQRGGIEPRPRAHRDRLRRPRRLHAAHRAAGRRGGGTASSGSSPTSTDTLPDDARVVKTVGDEVMVVATDIGGARSTGRSASSRDHRPAEPRIGSTSARSSTATASTRARGQPRGPRRRSRRRRRGPRDASDRRGGRPRPARGAHRRGPPQGLRQATEMFLAGLADEESGSLTLSVEEIAGRVREGGLRLRRSPSSCCSPAGATRSACSISRWRSWVQGTCERSTCTTACAATRPTPTPRNASTSRGARRRARSGPPDAAGRRRREPPGLGTRRALRGGRPRRRGAWRAGRRRPHADRPGGDDPLPARRVAGTPRAARDARRARAAGPPAAAGAGHARRHRLRGVRRAGSQWREDDSNSDERFARSRVRDSARPGTAKPFHPAALEGTSRGRAELLRDEAAVLDEVVDGALEGRYADQLVRPGRRAAAAGPPRRAALSPRRRRGALRPGRLARRRRAGSGGGG